MGGGAGAPAQKPAKAAKMLSEAAKKSFKSGQELSNTHTHTRIYVCVQLHCINANSNLYILHTLQYARIDKDLGKIEISAVHSLNSAAD